MSRFKIGDKVEVFLTSQPRRTYSQEESDIWNGTKGTVTHLGPIVGVTTTDGRGLRFYEHDLFLTATPPPAFASVDEAEAWLEAHAR